MTKANAMLDGVLKGDSELLRSLHEFNVDAHKIPMINVRNSADEDALQICCILALMLGRLHGKGYVLLALLGRT